MERLIFVLFMISFLSCTSSMTNKEEVVQDKITMNTICEGDIIFHTSKSSQSLAIQQVTQSQYSHMGIIFKDGNDFFVYEAIQPVSKTPLQSWINRGEEKYFIIKRIKDTILKKTDIQKMKKVALSHFGKKYDLTFEWNDDKMYCSEYVWKIYKEGLNLEIGNLQQLKEFDLSTPIVQQKVKERFGNNIPMEEKVISPQQMFQSSLLNTINNPVIK